VAIKNVTPPIIRDLFDELYFKGDLEFVERRFKQVNFVADTHHFPHYELYEG
jgi:hypothetical protein